MCVKKISGNEQKPQCKNCTYYMPATDVNGQCYYGCKMRLFFRRPMFVPAYGICNRFFSGKSR